jgi:hypothetical protein
MPLLPETESLMRDLLQKAYEEGVHIWGFTMDAMDNEIGQFGNFDPSLHFDNSISALATLGNKYKDAHKLARLKEN